MSANERDDHDPSLGDWWRDEFGSLPASAFYTCGSLENLDLIDADVRRLLVLLVHHPVTVGAVLLNTDPDTLGLPDYLVATFGALAQGTGPERVASTCGDAELARRIRWILLLPSAARVDDPAAEARDLVVRIASRRAA